MVIAIIYGLSLHAVCSDFITVVIVELHRVPAAKPARVVRKSWKADGRKVMERHTASVSSQGPVYASMLRLPLRCSFACPPIALLAFKGCQGLAGYG